MRQRAFAAGAPPMMDPLGTLAVLGRKIFWSLAPHHLGGNNG